MEGIEGFICFIAGFLVAVALWATDGSVSIDDAVKSGHAEYYLDENNERQWRWIEPTDKEAE